jgi:hypothetical protein
MRGVPNPQNDQPCVPSFPAVQPGSLTLKEPIPEDLAALGREVLELVPRKERASLHAYRQAANALSPILKATGVRVTPKVLYYTALRVKWITDNVRW